MTRANVEQLFTGCAGSPDQPAALVYGEQSQVQTFVKGLARGRRPELLPLNKHYDAGGRVTHLPSVSAWPACADVLHTSHVRQPQPTNCVERFCCPRGAQDGDIAQHASLDDKPAKSSIQAPSPTERAATA